MADDPRERPTARAIIDAMPDWFGDGQDLARVTRAALAAADGKDPLRVLLADRHRGEALRRRAILDPSEFAPRGTDSVAGWCTRALLAALREVAGL